MIDGQLERKIVPYLQSVCAKIASSATEGGNRPWVDFSDVEASSLQPVGKFDFEGIHKTFNRDEATNDYESRRVDKNTKVNELQTSKLSIDFLAGCERDWRARTRSRVRSFAHSFAAATVQGEDTGPLRRNTIDWLSRIMLEEPDK